jgi:hypothetical protein
MGVLQSIRRLKVYLRLHSIKLVISSKAHLSTTSLMLLTAAIANMRAAMIQLKMASTQIHLVQAMKALKTAYVLIQ